MQSPGLSTVLASASAVEHPHLSSREILKTRALSSLGKSKKMKRHPDTVEMHNQRTLLSSRKMQNPARESSNGDADSSSSEDGDSRETWAEEDDGAVSPQGGEKELSDSTE
ncbi:hypothetical protein AOLI_G00175710 [Acnodon oligacanthus]